MAKGPFKLRSGNSPLFKKMGSSSNNLNNFGIGKGASPLDIVPVDNPSSSDPWADALKKDPKLNEYVKERDKHKKGTPEYEAQQAKINAAHGKVRDQKTLARDKANLEKPTTERTTTDGNETTIEEKKKGAGLGGILVGALTGGLDAAYGSGKILPPSSARLIKKKVEKDTKTPGENIVDEIITGGASTQNLKKTTLGIDDE